MARIAAAAIGIFALCACSSTPPQPSAFYRSGNGLVETVRAVAAETPEPVRTVEAGGSHSVPLSTYSQPAYSSRAFPPESASTGSSAPGTSGPASQLTVRMDDGSRQSLIDPGGQFAVGDRVHVTPEGRVARQ
jgi:hypothetical protein